MGNLDNARRGWSDPDIRTAAVIVLGALAFVVVVGHVFRDVNPG